MQNMNIVILEDDPNRIRVFKRNLLGNLVFVTKEPRDAISRLRTGNVDVLFLDHDLGGTGQPERSGDDTGYEVARWLERNPKFQPKTIVIHSLNPVGQQNMKRALPSALIKPGVWDEL